jgi:hypothetical protein
MSSIADKVHERETTPAINILRANLEGWTLWCAELSALFRAQHEQRRGESCVAYHKRKLGRQTCCWVGGSAVRRFYIWDRPLWRIYVHNIGGVGFEVPVEASSEDVWAALRDYREAMGV